MQGYSNSFYYSCQEILYRNVYMFNLIAILQLDRCKSTQTYWSRPFLSPPFLLPPLTENTTVLCGKTVHSFGSQSLLSTAQLCTQAAVLKFAVNGEPNVIPSTLYNIPPDFQHLKNVLILLMFIRLNSTFQHSRLVYIGHDVSIWYFFTTDFIESVVKLPVNLTAL